MSLSECSGGVEGGHAGLALVACLGERTPSAAAAGSLDRWAAFGTEFDHGVDAVECAPHRRAQLTFA
jgi:hypothetical protein